MKLKTYQKRLVLVSLGILLALFLSWSFAFKSTRASFRELQQLESGLSSVESTRGAINRLKEQVDGMQLIHSHAVDSSGVKIIFKRISDLSDKHENLKIVSFPEVHKHQFKRYNIETLNVELEGDYENLLGFIHELESEKNIGRIVSAGFDLQKDVRTQKEFLRLKIYIQNTQKMS